MVLPQNDVSFADDVIKRLKDIEQDYVSKSMTELQYSLRKWAVLKPHINGTIKEEFTLLKNNFDDGLIPEGKYCTKIQELLLKCAGQYFATEGQVEQKFITKECDRTSEVYLVNNGEAFPDDGESITKCGSHTMKENISNGNCIEDEKREEKEHGDANFKIIKADDQSVLGKRKLFDRNQDDVSPGKKIKRENLEEDTEMSENGLVTTAKVGSRSEDNIKTEDEREMKVEENNICRVLRSSYNKVKLENEHKKRKKGKSKRVSTTDNSEEKYARKVPAKCVICRQLLDDPDLRIYSGHPNNAVEEPVVLTYPELNIYGEGDHPELKITAFTVYDEPGHLCPFDTGLIERDVLLYFSGYVKRIDDEVSTIEGGFPVKDMGPICGWWATGYDGGEKALAGFSTDYGDYYLMEPSEEYAPLMKTVTEKIYMGKMVIDLLLENSDATYEDLINKLQLAVPPSGLPSWTEEHLLRHAQFICDQVASFDDASDGSDDLLIVTPCMRTLVNLAGVTFGQRKAMRRDTTRSTKTEKAPWSKATTTHLVRNVFETFFPEQLDTTSEIMAPRRKCCGVCEACQRSDCGKCRNCRDQVKFGGSGRSKQRCIKRRCPYMAIQEADDSDLEEEEEQLVNLRSRNGLEPLGSVTRNWKSNTRTVKWLGEGIEDRSKTYFKQVLLDEELFTIGDCVLVQPKDEGSSHFVGQIVYMWETEKNKKRFHLRWFYRGCDTVLGETADPQELFVVDECEDTLLAAISSRATVVYKPPPKNWSMLGNCDLNILDEYIGPNDGKTFFYQKRYFALTARFEDVLDNPERMKAGFQRRFCPSCTRVKNIKEKNDAIVDEKLENQPDNKELHYAVVKWKGEEYRNGCCVFINPAALKSKYVESESSDTDEDRSHKDQQKGIKIKVDEDMYPELYRKTKDNVKNSNSSTPVPFVVGYVKSIFVKRATAGDIMLRIHRFYRPEDTCRSADFKTRVDLNLLFWSDIERVVNFADVAGKCFVSHKDNINGNVEEWSKKGPYRFYFDQGYNAKMKTFYESPFQANKIGYLGKGVENIKSKVRVKREKPPEWPTASRPLRTLDVFAGCGGLTEGLHQAKIAECMWAIEKDEPAARAFKLNNPNSTVFIEDCNDFLKLVINGKTENDKGQKLPMKGEVEMLCGGPPCQGFSGMNRFNHKQYSLFKNSLIVSFLSYCDYYRPRYFILENVRNFVCFKRSMVLKLTMRCLLKMGYQCTFGVLQAGTYGVPQTRRRVIILAAAPGEVLPQYPEPLHVFNPRGMQLSVLVDNKKFTTNCQWIDSAPYRHITVKDAISDLPYIGNGANVEEIAYGNEPKSHFQRLVRGPNNGAPLRDHVCKDMTPLVVARISFIPKERGADWRNLPNITVLLSDGTYTKKLLYTHDDKKAGKSSTGALRGVCSCASGRICDPMDRQYNTLIPWCLPHTGSKYNNWAGLYGRIEWDGYFATTITNPEPMGKQGQVLHPEQDRVVSVRECARSQGFPDSYRFYGNVLDKHRQIGNAVPPPMGAAIGYEIRKAVYKAEIRKNLKLNEFAIVLKRHLV